MSPTEKAGLLPKNQMISFQAVGLEVHLRLHHLVKASLAGSSLTIPYYAWHQQLLSHPAPNLDLEGILEPLTRLDEDMVHQFSQEWPRAQVVAALAVLESFYKAMISFGRKVLRPQGATPIVPGGGARQKNRSSESSEIYGPRLERIKDSYGLPFTQAEALLPDIERIARLRNEIAHDASLYVLREANPGEFYADAKPLPEVTYREAQEAQMLVGEFTDAIFVEAFEHLFSCSPQVRPLPPAVAAANTHLRQTWRTEAEAPQPVERIDAPGWEIWHFSDDGFMVTDDNRRVWISPTGIQARPALFSFPENKAHGRKVLWQVDDGDWIEAVGKASDSLLEAFLRGYNLVVKYQERTGAPARIISFSLAGFRDVWAEAYRLAEKKRTENE